MNLDKFVGCIMGVAIGDALGMPFETMTAQQIAQAVGHMSSFHSPAVNPRPFSSTKHLAPGSWTDDTQLTLVTMEALIASGGAFDMDRVAQEHIEAYRKKRGWGRSTRNAVKRLSQGVSWVQSGEPNGGGNGVIMKIAPLGLAQSIARKPTTKFLDECVTFAKMTHLVTPAIVGGAVHALAIAALARKKSDAFEVWQFLAFLGHAAQTLEQQLPEDDQEISGHLFDIINRLMAGTVQAETFEAIAARFGGGTSAAFSAYNSFGICYTLFARNPHSFDSVRDAIYIGGDTDSNASIVASLLGALHGVRIIPRDLFDNVEKSRELQERVRAFYDACNKTASD